MASGVISGSYRGYELQSRWSSTTNIAENYSTVNVEHYLVMASGYGLSIATKENNCNIDGSVGYFTSDRISSSGNETVKLGSTSHRVYHNNDGTKTANLTTTFNINATIGGVKVNNIVASGDIVLDTIPRASQPSCITYPQTTENIGTIGGTITIHMNRKSDSFTHTVRYGFGDAKGTIANNVTNNCQWEIPMELCNQIPNSVDGWGTVYVDTYNGDALIGTKSVNFKCSVPSTVVPTVGVVTLSETINNIKTKFGAYVKNKSKIQVLTAGQGTYGSTVTGIKVDINDTSYYTNPCTTSELKTAGTNNYTVTITDSRNRKGVKTGTFTVLDYENPKITSFKVVRDDNTPTSAIATINASISSVNNKNDKTFTLKYKKKNQTSYTSIALSNTNYTFNSTYTLTNLDENSSYDIVLEVKDYFGTSSSFADLPTAFTLINYRNTGKGMAFGKVSEKDEFEVAMPTEVTNKLNVLNYPANFDFGTRIKTLKAGPGTNGYILACIIKVLSTWANQPICFKLLQKERNGEIKILFANVDSVDPYIKYLYQSGNINAYIYKADTSTWNLYIQKQESYDYIDIVELYTGDYSDNRIKIIWKDEIATSLPTGYIKADIDKYSIDNTIPLYNNTSGTNGTITLSESARNFKYIEIFYGKTTSTYHNSVKVYSPSGKIVTMPYGYIGGDDWGQIGVGVASISDTTITRFNSGGFNFTNQQPVTVFNKNECLIFRVIGYR